MFTFTQSYAQKQLIKLHKFLLTNLPSYQEKCTIANLEVNPNFNQERNIGVPEGKILQDILKHLFKKTLLYFLIDKGKGLIHKGCHSEVTKVVSFCDFLFLFIDFDRNNCCQKCQRQDEKTH